MNPFYPIAQVIADLATIRALGFSVFPGFWDLTPEQVQAASNGTGPGSWSNSPRRILTDVEPEGARLAAIAHDIDYCCPNKSRYLFHCANHDFRVNQRIWARTRNWLEREAAECVAELQFGAVELWGWDAWMAGDTFAELAPRDNAGPERLA
jgi:hypothetical protein